MSRVVAYVMNGFPRLSETFIAHEIHQLERLGQSLRLFSVKREREPLVHPVVGAIRAPLVYLPEASSMSGTSLLPWLRANLGTFWPAHTALLKQRPLAWLDTAASAFALAVQHRPSTFTLRKGRIDNVRPIAAQLTPVDTASGSNSESDSEPVEVVA